MTNKTVWPLNIQSPHLCAVILLKKLSETFSHPGRGSGNEVAATEATRSILHKVEVNIHVIPTIRYMYEKNDGIIHNGS